MKLEVGMYVRSKEGTIEKVIDKYEAPYGYKVVVNEDFRFKHYEHNYIKHIIKASRNIIDLIEEGDYVNGMKVNNIAIEDGLIYLHMDADDCLHESTMLTGDEIKSIVTKEMFSSISYEVKE